MPVYFVVVQAQKPAGRQLNFLDRYSPSCTNHVLMVLACGRSFGLDTLKRIVIF